MEETEMDKFEIIIGRAISAAFGIIAVGALLAAFAGYTWHLFTAACCFVAFIVSFGECKRRI